MRAASGLFSALITLLTATGALAHGAHPTELDGHSHWIALAALASVGFIAFLAARSMESRKTPKQPEASLDTLEG